MGAADEGRGGAVPWPVFEQRGGTVSVFSLCFGERVCVCHVLWSDREESPGRCRYVHGIPIVLAKYSVVRVFVWRGAVDATVVLSSPPLPSPLLSV